LRRRLPSGETLKKFLKIIQPGYAASERVERANVAGPATKAADTAGLFLF